MAMLKGVSKPTQILGGTNDIDLDIFAQKQKELAKIKNGQSILVGMQELRAGKDPDYFKK